VALRKFLKSYQDKVASFIDAEATETKEEPETAEDDAFESGSAAELSGSAAEEEDHDEGEEEEEVPGTQLLDSDHESANDEEDDGRPLANARTRGGKSRSGEIRRESFSRSQPVAHARKAFIHKRKKPATESRSPSTPRRSFETPRKAKKYSQSQLSRAPSSSSSSSSSSSHAKTPKLKSTTKKPSSKEEQATSSPGNYPIEDTASKSCCDVVPSCHT
jgi:hypothetical protein